MVSTGAPTPGLARCNEPETTPPNDSTTFATAPAAARRGLNWLEVQITSTAEVKTAVESLVGHVDAILTPQDNTLASAFDAVVKTTRENGIPLFSLDTSSVERGAIASYGVDQYKLGLAWAKQVAVPVLLGQNPGTLVPVAYKDFELYVNTAQASAVGLTLAPELIRRARKTYDK